MITSTTQDSRPPAVFKLHTGWMLRISRSQSALGVTVGRDLGTTVPSLPKCMWNDWSRGSRVTWPGYKKSDPNKFRHSMLDGSVSTGMQWPLPRKCGCQTARWCHAGQTIRWCHAGNLGSWQSDGLEWHGIRHLSTIQPLFELDAPPQRNLKIRTSPIPTYLFQLRSRRTDLETRN